MPLANNYSSIQQYCSNNNAQLVVVTKQQTVPNIMEVYNAGGRQFGENHTNELTEKALAMPTDIQWHFIGHLQTNKAKAAVAHSHLIHSIDSLKLLLEVNKQASKLNKVQNCLLQLYIASEDTKHGLEFHECIELLRSAEYAQCTNIKVCGVMAMATNTKNTKQLTAEFQELVSFFKGLKQSFFANQAHFNIISAGMSNDYELAIQNGANMVRVGSAIFSSKPQ